MSNLNPKTIELTKPPTEILPKDVAAPKKKHIGLKAFAGTYSANVFIQISTVIQGVFIARMLGPDGRGEVATIMLWPSLMAQLGTVGSEYIFARIGAKEDENKSTLSALVFIAMTSVATMILGYFSIPYLISSQKTELITTIKLALIAIPFLQFGSVLGALDQGRGNFFRFNLGRSLASPFIVCFLITLFFLGRISSASVAFCCYGGAIIVGVLRLYWAFQEVHDELSIYPLMMIIKKTLPYGITKIAESVFVKLDQILVITLLSSSQIGIYTVALSAAGVVATLGNSIGLVGFTQAAMFSEKEGGASIALTFRRLALVSFSLAVGFGLLIPYVLPLIYGEAFVSAIIYSEILIPGVLILSLAGFLDQCLRGQGKPLRGVKGQVLTMFFFSTSGWLFAEIWGMKGIVVAFTMSQFLYLAWMIKQTIRNFNSLTLSSFFPKIKDIIQLKKSLLCRYFQLKSKILS